MMIIGVDYHPSFQTIAFFVEETGEYDERRLNHSDGEAERFYRDLQQRDFLMDDDFTDDPRLSDSQAAAGKSVLYPNCPVLPFTRRLKFRLTQNYADRTV